jgi:hypothetical protein
VFAEDSRNAVESVADLQPVHAESPDAGRGAEERMTHVSGSAPVPRTGKVIIRCGAVTKAGRPCTNAAGPDGHCIAHSRSPQVLATVQAARAAGGRAPRVRVGLAPAVVEAVDLRDSEGQLAVLTAATKALAQGSISSTTASAIAQLVKTAASIVATDQQQAIAELQARVEALVIDGKGGRR